MLAKVRISIRWARALGYVSRHDYDLALEQVQKIQKLFQRTKTDVPLKAEVNVLEGFLHYAEGNFQKSVDVLAEAIEFINASERYSGANKDYLKSFASTWGNKSLEEGRIRAETNFLVDYNSIQLDRVSDHLKRVFPLRDHPSWDEATVRKSWRVKQ